jgi:hypothetical protein
MHWEKHNDDLDTFDLLPRKVRVRSVQVPQSVQAPEQLTIHVQERVNVWNPPVVQEAGIKLERLADGGKVQATVYFQSIQPESLLAENIWKIRMGVLRENGDVEVILDVTRHDHFTKTSEPYVYEYSRVLSPEQMAQHQQYCSQNGRREYGTSIWFENAVGHVKMADRTRFIMHAI